MGSGWEALLVRRPTLDRSDAFQWPCWLHSCWTRPVLLQEQKVNQGEREVLELNSGGKDLKRLGHLEEVVRFRRSRWGTTTSRSFSTVSRIHRNILKPLLIATRKLIPFKNEIFQKLKHCFIQKGFFRGNVCTRDAPKYQS